MSDYYEVTNPVEKQLEDGTKKTYWTKVGVAFPLKSKDGFSIQLTCLPLNGKLVLQKPYKEQDASDTKPETERTPGQAARFRAAEKMLAPAKPLLDDEIPF